MGEPLQQGHAGGVVLSSFVRVGELVTDLPLPRRLVERIRRELPPAALGEVSLDLVLEAQPKRIPR